METISAPPRSNNLLSCPHMENPRFSKTILNKDTASITANLMLALFGLVAPLFTYFIAIANTSVEAKVAALTILAVVYAGICGWSFVKLRSTRYTGGRIEDDENLTGNVVALEAFDDAHAFFGNSLTPADMFRLVASRINAIIPHEAAMLLVPDADGREFQIKEAEHNDKIILRTNGLPLEVGVTGLAFLSGEVEIDATLERLEIFLAEDNEHLVKAAAAIPLIHDGAVFGVFVIFLSEVPKDAEATKLSLENIGDRIAPLFLGSFSLERSLSNAFTDTLTGLPNERAFYMVLENQLAESHRFRDERPLTVMTIDVRGFEEINRDLGHAGGDNVLKFVTCGLREQIRKMDFLARSANDEFLLVLPTATESAVADVLNRIVAYFNNNAYSVDEVQFIKISLNFGTATFWKDGETAKQLLGHANLRKTQSKSEEPDNVFWFPKEYVN